MTTSQTLPTREFMIACLDTWYHDHVAATIPQHVDAASRYLRVTAHQSYDGWQMGRANTQFSEFSDAPADHTLKTLFVTLSASRKPGEPRIFKTLDALHREAERMALEAGADLQLTIHRPLYQLKARPPVTQR